ncbi:MULTISPECIES: VOC family protein [Miniimonas]|uniref:VOC family protein n=1 Tax=Miniimonas TaxID=947525 RepID=UPI000D529EBD|nr:MULTISPECIES: VOC family protein [Miniimonas]
MPAPFPSTLDHVVLAGPDLAEAVAHVEALTGVRAAPGGAHPTGTANHLVAFTVHGERVPHYLEVIGPNPETGARAEDVETFGISGRTAPGVATFAVHPDDIDATASAAEAAGVRVGPVSPLSRRTPDGTLLEWRLTRGEGRDPDPAVPFLIDWGSTPQPGLSDLPTLELLELRVEHPDAEALAEKYRALGVDIVPEPGDAVALVLVVQGPDGPVELR